MTDPIPPCPEQCRLPKGGPHNGVYIRKPLVSEAYADWCLDMAVRAMGYVRHGDPISHAMCERSKHSDYPCTCGLDALREAIDKAREK